MLGNIGHAATLAARVYGIHGRPQGACEVLGELESEGLHADMPRHSLVEVLLDLERHLEGEKEIAASQCSQRLPEVWALHEFENVRLGAGEVVLDLAEVHCSHLHRSRSVQFDIGAVSQHGDRALVQKALKLDEPVACEPLLQLSGDAEVVVERMRRRGLAHEFGDY